VRNHWGGGVWKRLRTREVKPKERKIVCIYFLIK
jgi:hypothetical protein